MFLLLIGGFKPFGRLKQALTQTPHFYVAGLLLIGGSLFINIALTKLPIAELNILGMFTFPVSIVSAFLFYKEKPTIKKALSIVKIIIQTTKKFIFFFLMSLMSSFPLM